MFHWDDGLFLTSPRLALDVRRRQRVGFISHAHADHMARHELALCTAATARIYEHRLGKRRVQPLAFGKPFPFGDLELQVFPAGHILGSAMIHVRGETNGASQSLLYTGDFKLGESATATAVDLAALPPIDTLIMECTFGKPRYRLPPREEAIAQLVATVEQILNRGETPVLHLYPLGKSQEISRILTSHNIPVQQQAEIFALSQIYESCGVSLGKVSRYEGEYQTGHAVVTWPKSTNRFRLPGLQRVRTIAVSGWAIDHGAARRFDCDYVIPLSDHADFAELLQLVRAVKPREVVCLHGPREFLDHLESEKVSARWVDEKGTR